MCTCSPLWGNGLLVSQKFCALGQVSFRDTAFLLPSPVFSFFLGLSILEVGKNEYIIALFIDQFTSTLISHCSVPSTLRDTRRE